MKDVKGKVVLVTGAAMGMGKLLSEKFCEDGARVIMVDVNAESLKASIEEFKNRGFEVFDYVCDLTNRDKVYEMAEWVRENVGTVQALVNNAGVVYNGNFLDQDDEKISRTVDVNLKALMWTMKAFLPGMIENNEGHVLNLASASGFIGVPGVAVYAATKWGVIGLSESIRYELMKLKKNIKFTIVCPSYVATGMFEGVKPPKMTRFLTPQRIVDIMYDAFKKDKLYVLEPFMVKMTPSLKALLPIKAFDWVQKVFGVVTGADTLKGRQ